MGLFFNVRKPRKFNHQPIYYDVNKEALEERINKVKREMDMAGEDESYRPNIKGSIIDQTTHARKRMDDTESDRSAKTIRMAIILVLLIIAFYYFYIR